MTTDRPRVSIVLVRYHGAEFLAATLDACLRQTLADIEVVLVDPLTTEAQVALATTADTRVRTVRAPADSALAALWNLGAAQARGDFLMVLTDTERLEPDALERMLALMPEGSGVECVYAGFRTHDLSTDIVEDVMLTTTGPADGFLGRVSPCYLFSRAAWQRVGGWDERCEPAIILDHWIRLFRTCGVRHCDAVLCEQVVWPWRTKNPDWIDLGLFEAAVRQQHDLSARNELKPWLQRYIARIWKEPGDWRLLWRWFAPTGRRLARMSPALAVWWLLASAGIVLRRGRGPVTDEVILRDLRPRWSGRFRRVRRPGRQVLCLIPRIVMGGSEKVVRDIVCGLKPHGYRFHLCAEHGNRDRWCRAFMAEFDNVVQIDLPGNDIPDPDGLAAYLEFLSRAIQDFDIDLILISNAFPAYAVLPELRRAFPDLPIVDLLHVERYSGMSAEFLDRAPYVDRRVCINGHLQTLLEREYAAAGMDAALAQRIEVILNGHDLRRFDPAVCPGGRFRARHGIPADARIVASIARMEADKRPRLFVEVADRMVRDNPDLPLHFVMAGDGLERHRTERLIEARGLARNFHLTGILEYDRVCELLGDSDMLLIVSEMEGLPLVMVEAMSMDVPVVATDVGGIHDVIEHEHTGFLVDPASADLPAQFAKHATRLLRDPSLYDAIAARTRTVVRERFALERMHARYTELFDSLVAASKQAA